MPENTGLPKAEALCREVYAEVRQKYADAAAGLGAAALGFRILYGPPVVGAPYFFIGFQPGGREIENCQHHTAWPQQCEYATAEWPLAKKIRNIWGKDVVAQCTGLNAIFFRAPNLISWMRVPAPLRNDLQEFSLLRAQAIVDVLQPERVVLIGLKTFDLLVEGKPCLRGDRGRVLAKDGTLWGRPAIGVLHLSGARFSCCDYARLRAKFSNQASSCQGRQND